MTRHPRGVLCERARSWAALAPDNELSELEQRLLDAHLTRCAGCRTFAAHVTEITAALRRESLKPLGRPLEVPLWRRRTAYARMRTVGAAAAVAAMALGVASRAPLSIDSAGEGFRQAPVVQSDDVREMNELRDFRRELLVGARLSPGRHFGDQPA